jgi:hypothetical protein
MLASPLTAHAQPAVAPTITAPAFGIKELVEGKIPVTVTGSPPTGNYSNAAGDCTLSLAHEGNDWSLKKAGKCNALWGARANTTAMLVLAAAAPGGMTFSLTVSPKVEGKEVTADLDGQKVTLKCSNTVPAYSLPPNGEWAKGDLPCQFENVANTAYVVLNGPALSALKLAPVTQPVTPLPAPPATILPGPYDDDAKSLDHCRTSLMWKEERTICIRVDKNHQAHLVHLPSRYRDRILPPNTSLDVLVVHAPPVKIEASLSGEQALSSPALLNSEFANEAKGVAGVAPGAAEPAVAMTSAFFGPRRPDSAADLTITAVNGTTKVPWKLEMFVEKTYSGALRIGIGVLFGRAVDHDYSAVKVDNSSQHELVARTGGRAEFELVVGYAPYVFDMIAGRKGRAYQSTTLAQRAAGFAPYIGLGTLSVGQGTGIEFFRTIHLGLEWEPLRNFSIAATFVMRRVTRLQHGYEVGSPVNSGDPPTREQLALGFGLVLNLTPEFFRFATRGSSSLLRGTSSEK